ncbi:hypothetical protein VULLAG_LOCUS7723 [Vulpes lagopus]
MERTILFRWNINDRGDSMMLTLLKESHAYYLHKGHHVAGHRNIWNQPEQQRTVNLSTLLTSDHLPTKILPLHRGVTSSNKAEIV